MEQFTIILVLLGSILCVEQAYILINSLLEYIKVHQDE